MGFDTPALIASMSKHWTLGVPFSLFLFPFGRTGRTLL